MSKFKDSFLVAQFGKTHGLKGELKLHLHTDFPEQFTKGRTLRTDRGDFVIEHYNPKRKLIKIEGFNTPEDAKKLTNAKIYSSKEETKEYCKLEKGQYFWFDLIGCEILEAGEILGAVKDIQRLPQGDYFLIDTSKELIKEGFAKTFLLPYLEHFIISVDINSKKIEAKGAKDILEAS